MRWNIITVDKILYLCMANTKLLSFFIHEKICFRPDGQREYQIE